MPNMTLQQRIEHAIRNAPASRVDVIARSVIEELGLREVHTVAWDGELSASGQPHRAAVSAEISYKSAEQLLGSKHPGSWYDRHPGARIERRVVGSWERT